jgi:tRNA dimethylallyltransferase
MTHAVVPVIVGPTAAGKSAVAMFLAGEHAVTIVSADSRQVYRGFDAGTAKPSPAEQARVPHRGIDLVEPTERYSAARWADDAERWIAEAGEASRVPLVVGGTGFYLRALFSPLFREPPLDLERRRQLEPVLATFPLAELRRWCMALDPARAHLGRSQLLRAIEVALLTGQRLSDLHVLERRPARATARYLLVDPGAALQERIRTRTLAMLRDGWQEEVRALAERVPADAPAWNATGYQSVRALVEGSITESEAVEAIVTETRQYAKRQRTWFRHQLAADDVTHLDPTHAGWQDDARRWLAQEQTA